MDDERFTSSTVTRENPRAAARPPVEAQLRVSPSILDRFRAMLREREEELRAAGIGEGDPPPPYGREIVGMYEELLSELTFNSKPIITELTIIAGEQREHAKGIADAVCARIDEVPQDQKLPSLYLLDSIVKNIGREYVRYFASRLPKVFCEAYSQVHSSLHPAMRHLFGTWSQVFPVSVLSKIEDRLKLSTPENQRPPGLANVRNSETPPRPSSVIHINPKYLEARKQFENPAMELQPSRDVSSAIQAYGQKTFIHSDDCDSDYLDFQSPYIRMLREGSSHSLGSSVAGQEGPILKSQKKLEGPLSPTRIGFRRSMSPRGQSFQRSSPGRVVESTSPFRSELEFGSQRASERHGFPRRNWTLDDGILQPDALVAYNGCGRQHQRELIDAYGNYRGKGTVHDRFPKVQRLEYGETINKGWQNSEEEEYVWEDMSPTLADQGSMLSETTRVRFDSRVDSSKPSSISQPSDFIRRSWPAPMPEYLRTINDEKIAFRAYGHGPVNKKYLDNTGNGSEQLRHCQSSHYTREHGNTPDALHNSSQNDLSPKSQAGSSQLPYFLGGTSQAITQRWHHYDNSQDAEVPFHKLSNTYNNSLNTEASTILTQKAHQHPVAPIIWPPHHKTPSLPILPTLPNQHLKSPFDYVDTNKPLGHQINFSGPMTQQQIDANARMPFSKSFQVPHRQSGPIPLNLQSKEQKPNMVFHPTEAHSGFIPPMHQTPAKIVAQPLNGTQSQGQVVFLGPNPIPGMTASAVSPPLPPGPPPSSSQPGLTTQISNLSSSTASHPPVSAFSGLINTLMAQGLISLSPPVQSQSSVLLEFNAELLKMRHESTINAMYMELPRQCTTCGLRFKCQEDHSSHMDWHVTKNRISKNRKQKPSRKWFVSAKEWLCGAETLGNDVVPGFLPAETVTEKKEDRELAVPADENQTICALCGEPFEDFYSDETEEWMYRGAVYLNAPDGNIEGLDRSQLGPIVHAKCRSESTEGSGPI
ncbi:hypothetical protein AXF42_Ash015097 [Apostasia shenzhenica]|uniref:CID domain-containing protein n=1 Tax=Apostasia shenzhenica TaxID=1088818 RepID=A0A2I0B341_9ASPA|nr:hypothetical protein AXF42_Ash015097 [Apostasia shenzhenica]